MKSKRKRFALIVSVGFHAVLLVTLFVVYLPNRKSAEAPSGAGTDAGQSSTSVAAPDDSSAAESSANASQPIEVSDSEIERSIESQMEQAERLDRDHQMSELEKNLNRLESVANAESVNQVTERIAGTLGLDTQQYAEKPEPADGDFDIDTSQLEDVSRIARGDGSFQYESVMVDAAGRKVRVPLTREDGEQLYETFQLMKQYPLAGGIYRSVVMPMMQKMLEAKQIELPEIESPDANQVNSIDAPIEDVR